MQNFTTIDRFNLRVYAIIRHENKVLLADENINNFAFTKFPGGGVELGEGLIEALKRELLEEGQIEINHLEHFYTTEFFQPSAFKKNEQIIAVYYLVDAKIEWTSKSTDQSDGRNKHALTLYFKAIEDIKKEDLSFPIDQIVFEKLKSRI